MWLPPARARQQVETSAKAIFLADRHPELVEGSVQPPSLQSNGTDPSTPLRSAQDDGAFKQRLSQRSQVARATREADRCQGLTRCVPRIPALRVHLWWLDLAHAPWARLRRLPTEAQGGFRLESGAVIIFAMPHEAQCQHSQCEQHPGARLRNRNKCQGKIVSA